jgi:hypothetical protein
MKDKEKQYISMKEMLTKRNFEPITNCSCVEEMTKDLTETKAQGYKVENGKIVYFSNMLNGYKYEYKDLKDVCAEMNGLLEKFNSYDEQLYFWKGKAEEKLPKDSVVLSKEEYEKLKNNQMPLDPVVLTMKQYLDINHQAYFKSKETAEKIFSGIYKLLISIRKQDHEDSVPYYSENVEEFDDKLYELAKQFGVEIKE